MTIWLLALVLLASCAGLGYRQGAIRVGFSFFGILIGAVLSPPLGRLMGKFLMYLGLKDPPLVWALGPIIVFILISIGVKAAAAAAHHKVDVYYKYHAGDLRLTLWERLNRRAGLALGLLNGTAYFILIAFLISVPSYLTFQLASSEKDPKTIRWLNTLGQDLHSTGIDKVARAIDSVPQIDYDMADFLGLLYRNPLIEARLSSYPGFFALGERGDFQAIADQTGSDRFTEAWMRQDPFMELLARGEIQNIRNSPEALKTIWDTIVPDLPDLNEYLKTGHTKYDSEKILGRWQFDVNAAIAAFRRANPTISSTDMQKRKRLMQAAFSKTTLVARPDSKVLIKNMPKIGANNAPQQMEGEWKEVGSKYQLSFSGNDLPATLEIGRLAFKAEGWDMVFSRED
jgi:hypothetical protein